ncbi:MAG: AMP-binding protein [Blastocatellia bacterium]
MADGIVPSPLAAHRSRSNSHRSLRRRDADLQGYGLTESSPVITANTAQVHRLGSCGKAIPGVKVKDCRRRRNSASGPNIGVLGYYNKLEATLETLSPDDEGNTWLHTGDIGHLDADGFLYITDRKKDLIKTSVNTLLLNRLKTP